MRKALLFVFMTMLGLSASADKLETYPAPKGAPLNGDFTVKVRQQGDKAWRDVAAYAWNVDKVIGSGHHTEVSSVAYFCFEGKVEVSVTANKGKINTCRVRPLSYNIDKVVTGNTITFTLDRPRNLSVEVNGDIYHNLQLFANPILPKVKKGKRVVYFAPGYHELKEQLVVKSGQTVYLAGGAFVEGTISVWQANNVKVIGPGIVNPRKAREGIMIRYSKNVEINGPITTQIPVGGCDSVSVNNAKVISWYGWGDGMNVFASNNISYNHVFCRTSDDCSTIYCTRKDYHGGCRNIRINDAVYWADVAHPIMIGLHGDIDKNEVIEDVVYNDIDILQQAENQIDYQGCIGINDGDNNLCRNILFQNIRIEELTKGMLFNFRVCYNKKYCHAPGRGIHDITLRNISYNGTNANMSVMTGYDSTRVIKNIRFENLVINGNRISDTMAGKPKWYKTSDMANIFVGDHVEGVTFE